LVGGAQHQADAGRRRLLWLGGGLGGDARGGGRLSCRGRAGLAAAGWRTIAGKLLLGCHDGHLQNEAFIVKPICRATCLLTSVAC